MESFKVNHGSINPKRLTNNSILTSLHQRPLANSGSLFIVVRELFHQIDIPNDLLRVVILLIHLFEYQVSISGGENHCLLLTNDGDIYGWGKNNDGQLGVGDDEDRIYSDYPKKILQKLDGVSSVACGVRSSYAVLKSGKVYAWGLRDSQHHRPINKPLRLKELERISMISCGRNHCLAVNFDGEVFSWGDDYKLNTQGYSKRGHLSPEKVDFNIPNFQLNANTTTIPISFVSCGRSHSIAVSKEGKLYSWGRSSFGQLGNGNVRKTRLPSIVTGNCYYGSSSISSLENVLSVVCGSYHTIVLTKDGRLFSWGSDQYGQLGINLRIFAGPNTYLRYWNTPQEITSIGFSASIQIVMIACGDSHSLALTKDGHVYSWGYNNYGQLGLGENNFVEENDNNIENNNHINNANSNGNESKEEVYPICVYSPQKIVGFDNIALISCGANFSLAISNEGIIYTWGRTLVKNEKYVDVYPFPPNPKHHFVKITYPTRVM